MARNGARQNRPSQPTNTSVLSACAKTTTSAASACATKFYAYLTDAALAVSVFAFFSLAVVVFELITVSFAVLLGVVFLVYLPYVAYRLRYGIQLAAKTFQGHFPCSHSR